MEPPVTLRPLQLADLGRVDQLLREPQVARWWTSDTTAERELERFRRRLVEPAETATRMYAVELGGTLVGWCQWYRWQDYPSEAAAVGAGRGEVGADYAVGDPGAIARGVGTRMVAALVSEIWRHEPQAGLLVAPQAANTASRRVLEKNGFLLVEVRPVSTEPHNRPMAIYRLGPPPAS
jgi:RimJ/RimL family protein N-acetyltransferase